MYYNYHPHFGKHFGSMIEKKISTWVEKEEKRTKGKDDFMSNNSTINHCTTLGHLIEKVWDTQGGEVIYFFVDFKKYFDMVSRRKVWSRMENLKL